MKKNFFAAFATLAALVFTTSCSSEDLMSENLTAEKAENLITLDAPVKTTVASTEGQGSVRRWRLSDGQTVTAHHESNGIEVNEIKLVNIEETPVDENTVNVNVTVSSRSAANTITKSVSYAKVVKAEHPVKPDTVVVTPDPVLVHEYFVADTTMTIKKYNSASKQVKLTMNHKLTKVSVWSDNRRDSVEIWNKKFTVAQTWLNTKDGDNRTPIYARTAAADLRYTSNFNWYTSTETPAEGVVDKKREGGFHFNVDYINDANYAHKWDGENSVEEHTIVFNYEGYQETYDFRFTGEFVNQEVKNLGFEDLTLSGGLYRYEATVIGNYSLQVNGMPMGILQTELDVYHYGD